MRKIVSNNTSKTKRKGKVYKCDLCVRKFVSVNALKTHHRVQHNLQPFKTRPKQYENTAKKLEVKDTTAKNFELNDRTLKTPIIESIMTTKHTSNIPNTTKSVFRPQNAQPANDMPISKVEFECPRCFLSFNTYPIAAQHIQKFHYADKKAPMNIQPERIEMCMNCKRKVRSIPTHVCGAERWEGLNIIYSCLACNKRFNNLRLFYTHVVSVHANGAESFFFPTNHDLARWKQDVEYQTNGSYSQFVKVDSKYYAHCMQACGKSTRMANVCPSLIMLQEFPKGIQVHYYGHHIQHPFTVYKLPSRFKKFSITSFLKASDSYFQLKDLKSDDNDLYLQFKQLMESVVLDAAKLKRETLTVLFGHALEMTSMLSAYDNDDDMSDDGAKADKRNMTDTDIEKALEETSVLNNTSSNEPHKKKVRHNSEAPPPMILNSFSLAKNVEDATKENSITEKAKKPNIKVKDLGTLQDPKLSNVGEETPKGKTIDLESTPSSFNESFAVFLEKNFPGNDSLRRSKRSSKPMLKTKIGQYKPPSPQKIKPDTPPNKNDKSLTVEKPQQSVLDSPKTAVPLQPAAQLPKGKNNTIETRQKSNLGITEVVQKVSLSNVSIEVNKVTQANNLPNHNNVFSKSKDVIVERPKPISAITREIKPKPKIDKPKVDIKYEVKERKDDCNILILKI